MTHVAKCSVQNELVWLVKRLLSCLNSARLWIYKCTNHDMWSKVKVRGTCLLWAKRLTVTDSSRCGYNRVVPIPILTMSPTLLIMWHWVLVSMQINAPIHIMYQPHNGTLLQWVLGLYMIHSLCYLTVNTKTVISI